MELQLQTLNASERAAVWAERIAACRSSALSVRAWCRENQLSEKTYYYWQQRLYKLAAQHGPIFAEIASADVRPKPSVAVTVHIGNGEVEIYNGAEPGIIQAIIAALKSC